MPVPQIAVDKYLSRQVENLTWFKHLKPLEVEEYLSYMKPRHQFTMPLWLDQKICFLLGAAYPDILLLTDLGLGKTGVSLELLTYWYKNGFIRKAIVFAPTNEVAEGWEDEIHKWGFDLPYVRLSQNNSRDKWDALEGFEKGIIIGTYMGISAMVADLVPIPKKKKKQRQITWRKLLRLAEGVDAIIFDQSTKLGSTKSLTFEVCDQLSKETQIRYGLAGRPFGRDPFILWSQFHVVDRGRALGNSVGMFREAFWRRERNFFGTEWVKRKRRQKDLAKFISASSIRYSVDECRDLPKRVPPIVKYCTLPDESVRYYEDMREKLLASRGNYREVKSTFLRMRQISSGFVGFIDDDTGDRAQIEFDENPKLDLLMELIEEVPEDCKVFIVHEFNWSGAAICNALAKAKYKHGWLYGGTKDWTGIKNSLHNDPDYRVLVANWRKAAMGLNLQPCSYTFFYESPVSVIERYETEGRTRRTGQTKRCFYYDLVMRDTVDENILDFHREGRDLFKVLVEDPNRVIKRKRS